MDVTQLLGGDQPIPQHPTVQGYISLNQPAPSSYTDKVYVIAPGYSIDRPLGPCKWPAIHGSTKPAQGTPCVVAFDDQGVPVVVWWDGAYTAPGGPPTGSAGGVLSGTYPNPGFAGGEWLQNGVVNAGDGVVSSLAVSAAGVITGTMATGPCYVTTTFQGRYIIPGGAFTLTPASLPATGQYAIVGVDIDSTPSLQASVKGTDQASQALALTNSPATASGRVRLLDVVILNTAGTYSLSTSRDRRPWARGAESVVYRTAGDVTVGSASYTTVDSALIARIECTGVPMVVGFSGSVSVMSAGQANLGLFVDGTQVDEQLYGSANVANVEVEEPLVPWTYVPSAGSHLFEVKAKRTAVAKILANTTNRLAMVVEEKVRQNANNGTS